MICVVMILSEEQSSRIVLGREIIEQETSGIQAVLYYYLPRKTKIAPEGAGLSTMVVLRITTIL